MPSREGSHNGSPLFVQWRPQRRQQQRQQQDEQDTSFSRFYLHVSVTGRYWQISTGNRVGDRVILRTTAAMRVIHAASPSSQPPTTTARAVDDSSPIAATTVASDYRASPPGASASPPDPPSRSSWFWSSSSQARRVAAAAVPVSALSSMRWRCHRLSRLFLDKAFEDGAPCKVPSSSLSSSQLQPPPLTLAVSSASSPRSSNARSGAGWTTVNALVVRPLADDDGLRSMPYDNDRRRPSHVAANSGATSACVRASVRVRERLSWVLVHVRERECVGRGHYTQLLVAPAHMC